MRVNCVIGGKAGGGEMKTRESLFIHSNIADGTFTSQG
jgi:hypothetical protein